MDQKFNVSLSVDNTNAIIGRKKTKAFSGCPCHLAHLAATPANDSFTEIIDVNVLIDLNYWFDNSTKRKGKLAEYFEFRDQENQQVLKHVTSYRWLSLERCIKRALKKFRLKSYFPSDVFFKIKV